MQVGGQQLVQCGIAQFGLGLVDLLHAVGTAVAGESQHLAGVAVEHALELLAAADGPVHGVGLDAQDLLDVLHQLKGVAGFAVHLVDEGEDGDVTQGADLEQLDGLGLNALCRIDDHDSGVRCHQGTVGILREVLMARGIQNVHALACIVELQDRGSDRNTALLFDVHPVGHSVLGALLALDGTGLIDGSTVQQQFFGQGRFTGIGVADDRKRPAALDLFTICHILISPKLMGDICQNKDALTSEAPIVSCSWAGFVFVQPLSHWLRRDSSPSRGAFGIPSRFRVSALRYV